MGEQLFQELGTVIEESMAHNRVPGVAAGVLYEGEVYTDGFGVTNVEHPLPVDEHTLFQIGSTTKTVTATAMMRLIEMGKLDLDTPIRHYLDDFKMLDKEATERATVRHLLTHTGGWAGDYFSDTGMGDEALAEYVREMAMLPQLTSLGSLWTYNNAGFSLAGRVIEVVTGQSYEAVATELVLHPLGMVQSFFFANDVMTYRFATGHFSIEGESEPIIAQPWALARSAHSAGGIISSVSDQLRYARFHLGDGLAEDGKRILSKPMMYRMQQPTLNANLGNKFGLSWFIKQVGDVKIVSHGGATKGQQSAFLLVPERGFAITVLTNSDQGSYLHGEVTKWALRRYLDVVASDPEPQERPVEELEEYTGDYDAQLALISFALENDELVMCTLPHGGFPDKNTPPPPPPPPTRVAFTGGDEIVALDPPHSGNRAEFIRDETGQIRWFRTSRLHRRL